MSLPTAHALAIQRDTARATVATGGADVLAELRRLVLDDAHHGPATRQGLASLGDLRGRRVVDMGCGDGRFAVLFALVGARVVGLDMGGDALRQASQLARRAGVAARCSFIQGSSEGMPLPTASVDLLFSRSTLQYVNRARALSEVARVVKPGGRVVLIENLPHNPFVNAYRLLRWLRTRGSLPPLGWRVRGYVTHAEIDGLAAGFGHLQRRDFELLRVLALGLRSVTGRATAALDAAASRMDDLLLRALPPLRRLAWYSVVTGVRRPGSSRR